MWFSDHWLIPLKKCGLWITTNSRSNIYSLWKDWCGSVVKVLANKPDDVNVNSIPGPTRWKVLIPTSIPWGIRPCQQHTWSQDFTWTLQISYMVSVVVVKLKGIWFTLWLYKYLFTLHTFVLFLNLRHLVTFIYVYILMNMWMATYEG